jgi:hypothetical protein
MCATHGLIPRTLLLEPFPPDFASAAPMVLSLGDAVSVRRALDLAEPALASANRRSVLSYA